MKTPSFCKVNINTVIQAVILGSFSILFVYLLTTGRIASYLHPRMTPFVIFAAIAFFLMMLALFRSFKKRERRFSMMPVFVFVFPVILACTVPGKAITGSSLTFTNAKIVGISSSIQTTASKATQNSNGESSSSASSVSSSTTQNLKPNQSAVTTTSPFGTPITLIITDNTISMDDQNIVSWVNELNSHPDNYVGKKIEYTGYVFKSGKDFKSDEFVPGRDMMWCCAADIQLVGVLCRYDKTSGLKENSWVKVTGTLTTSTYQGSKVPLIVNPDIEPASKPKEEYVYPSY